MTAIGRLLARVEVPFTPATYDAAFPIRGGSLPGLGGDGQLSIPAAYACTVVVSEDIAKVPLSMFARTEANGKPAKSEATNHPLHELLHDQPNDEQTALEFREWMTAVALNRGRAIAEITAGPRGPVDQLTPLYPDRIVGFEVVPATGQRVLNYNDPRKGMRRIPRDELFILRGRFGKGVIEYARRSFEVMHAQMLFQSELYGRGLRSPGYLSHPKTLSDPARERLRKALDAYGTGGERAGRPLLLEEGMKWETIALSLEDAEFLASLQHSVADVCRWYRVPQHKVNELIRATENNVAQLSTDYVTDSLLGWAERWEQAIRRDLIIAKAKFYAEHNLDGLLRGDTLTRFQAYQIAVTFGWMTRAEVREKENMNPIDGLELALLPLNMAAQVAGGNPGAGPISGAQIDRPVVAYLRVLVRDGAARIVRKETASLAKLAERTGGTGDEWRSGVRTFYREHAEFVGRVLRLPDEAAEEYCLERQVMATEIGPSTVDDEMTYLRTVSALTRLALTTSTVLQLEDRPAAPALSGDVSSIADLIAVA